MSDEQRHTSAGIRLSLDEIKLLDRTFLVLAKRQKACEKALLRIMDRLDEIERHLDPTKK